MSEQTTQPAAGGKPQATTAATPEAVAKGDAKAAAKGDATAAAEAGKKPLAGVPLPLILLVAGALAAGGAAGGLFVAPRILAARAPAAHGPAPAQAATPAPAGESHGGGGKEEKGGKHGGGGKTAAFRLDNLIVNPAGTQGTRFLMASVVFEFPDEQSQEMARDHEAQVRDLVIATLERQTLEQLTRPGAREQIKKELLVAVAPVTGEQRSARVFLPQFVLQ